MYILGSEQRNSTEHYQGPQMLKPSSQQLFLEDAVLAQTFSFFIQNPKSEGFFVVLYLYKHRFRTDRPSNPRKVYLSEMESSVLSMMSFLDLFSTLVFLRKVI